MLCAVPARLAGGFCANLAGRFKDVGCRLGIEGADRTVAATVPHSTQRCLTERLLDNNLFELVIFEWITVIPLSTRSGHDIHDVRSFG